MTYESDRPMADWSDAQLLEYLYDGVPSREAAQQLLHIRTAVRNREASNQSAKSARRIEIATFIMLAVALVQAFATAAPFFR